MHILGPAVRRWQAEGLSSSWPQALLGMQLMPLGPGHLTTLQPNAAAEFQKIHAGPLRTSFSLRYLVASEALQCWSSLDVIEIFGLRTLSGCHAEQSPCSMFMYAGLWQQEVRPALFQARRPRIAVTTALLLSETCSRDVRKAGAHVLTSRRAMQAMLACCFGSV